MKQKVMKVGNSLGVTIPSNFVKTAGVMRGGNVEVTILPQKGKIIYTFDGNCQLPLENLYKQSV